MSEVSTVRLYMLRAMYALITFGLGSMMWPRMFNHPQWGLMHSVAASMLAALSLLMAVGIRYPLQMLPLLLFELAWKLTWLSLIALPLHLAGEIDPATMQTVFECIVGAILVPIAVPWGYVMEHYVKRPSDRWRFTPVTRASVAG
jgi:hypothetical protein